MKKQYRKQTQHIRRYRSGRWTAVNRGIRYQELQKEEQKYYLISTKPFGKVVYTHPGKAYVIETKSGGFTLGNSWISPKDEGLTSLGEAERLADSVVTTYSVQNFGVDPVYKAKNQHMLVVPEYYIPIGSKDEFGQEEGLQADPYSGLFNLRYETRIGGYKDLNDAILSAEDIITMQAPWGQHIPLRCKKCGKLFSTKNIGSIGSRNIFPQTVDCEHGTKGLELAEDLLSEWERRGKPIGSKEQAKKLFENIRAKNTLLMNLREGALKPQLVARGFTREEIDRTPLHIIEGVISERNDASELKRIPQDILDKFVSKGLLPKEYQSGGI